MTSKSPRHSLAQRLERSRRHRQWLGKDSTSVGGGSVGGGSVQSLGTTASEPVVRLDSASGNGSGSGNGKPPSPEKRDTVYSRRQRALQLGRRRIAVGGVAEPGSSSVATGSGTVPVAVAGAGAPSTGGVGTLPTMNTNLPPPPPPPPPPRRVTSVPQPPVQSTAPHVQEQARTEAQAPAPAPAPAPTVAVPPKPLPSYFPRDPRASATKLSVQTQLGHAKQQQPPSPSPSPSLRSPSSNTPNSPCESMLYQAEAMEDSQEVQDDDPVVVVRPYGNQRLGGRPSVPSRGGNDYGDDYGGDDDYDYDGNQKKIKTMKNGPSYGQSSDAIHNHNHNHTTNVQKVTPSWVKKPTATPSEPPSPSNRSSSGTSYSKSYNNSNSYSYSNTEALASNNSPTPAWMKHANNLRSPEQFKSKIRSSIPMAGASAFPRSLSPANVNANRSPSPSPSANANANANYAHNQEDEEETESMTSSAFGATIETPKKITVASLRASFNNRGSNQPIMPMYSNDPRVRHSLPPGTSTVNANANANANATRSTAGMSGATNTNTNTNTTSKNSQQSPTNATFTVKSSSPSWPKPPSPRQSVPQQQQQQHQPSHSQITVPSWNQRQHDVGHESSNNDQQPSMPPPPTRSVANKWQQRQQQLSQFHEHPPMIKGDSNSNSNSNDVSSWRHGQHDGRGQQEDVIQLEEVPKHQQESLNEPKLESSPKPTRSVAGMWQQRQQHGDHGDMRKTALVVPVVNQKQVQQPEKPLHQHRERQEDVQENQYQERDKSVVDQKSHDHNAFDKQVVVDPNEVEVPWMKDNGSANDDDGGGTLSGPPSYSYRQHNPRSRPPHSNSNSNNITNSSTRTKQPSGYSKAPWQHDSAAEQQSNDHAAAVSRRTKDQGAEAPPPFLMGPVILPSNAPTSKPRDKAKTDSGPIPGMFSKTSPSQSQATASPLPPRAILPMTVFTTTSDSKATVMEEEEIQEMTTARQEPQQPQQNRPTKTREDHHELHSVNKDNDIQDTDIVDDGSAAMYNAALSVEEDDLQTDVGKVLGVSEDNDSSDDKSPSNNVLARMAVESTLIADYEQAIQQHQPNMYDDEDDSYLQYDKDDATIPNDLPAEFREALENNTNLPLPASYSNGGDSPTRLQIQQSDSTSVYIEDEQDIRDDEERILQDLAAMGEASASSRTRNIKVGPTTTTAAITSTESAAPVQRVQRSDTNDTRALVNHLSALTVNEEPMYSSVTGHDSPTKSTTGDDKQRPRLVPSPRDSNAYRQGYFGDAIPHHPRHTPTKRESREDSSPSHTLYPDGSSGIQEQNSTSLHSRGTRTSLLSTLQGSYPDELLENGPNYGDPELEMQSDINSEVMGRDPPRPSPNAMRFWTAPSQEEQEEVTNFQDADQWADKDPDFGNGMLLDDDDDEDSVGPENHQPIAQQQRGPVLATPSPTVNKLSSNGGKTPKPTRSTARNKAPQKEDVFDPFAADDEEEVMSDDLFSPAHDPFSTEESFSPLDWGTPKAIRNRQAESSEHPIGFEI